MSEQLLLQLQASSSSSSADLNHEIDQLTGKIVDCLRAMSLVDQIETLNQVRQRLHECSPMRGEPVDFVRWVPSGSVYANDYNPNSVAPPEMELLAHSILTDGYTQPIVTLPTDKGREVVDGFHRNRVGKENPEVAKRVNHYLPVVSINASQAGLNDRIAATIRHNRARGKHSVDAMSDIVIELKRRNWSDARIGKELGMDPDEVLRLTQITGLSEVFAGQEFSEAWESDNVPSASSEILSDIIEGYTPKKTNRILHTWEEWECYKAGFYAERPPGRLSQEDGEKIYAEFLSDLKRFGSALNSVISEWKNSCEHYLTNDRMNRIAWLGQASAAYATQMPSGCRGGYNRLSTEQQQEADLLALEYLNKWLAANNRPAATMAEALGRTDAELY
jgi:hypothetical protein